MLKKFTFCALFLCCAATFLPRLRAQDTKQPAKIENRFLFIIDTSSAMARQAQAGRNAVQKLLESGIEGQLREGDTIGVWTYNDKLHDGFPMQIWSESAKQTISDTILTYLNSQKWEKKSHLDRVLPSMYAVVKASRTLTVILISDGSAKMKGTSFDADINDLHKEYGKNLRAANLPFVTILASRNGAIFDYTVNSPADTIRVPKTAEPEKKATPPLAIQKPATPSPSALAAAISKPEVAGIVIGDPNPPKPAPVAAPAPVSPAPETKPEPVATTPAIPEPAPASLPSAGTASAQANTVAPVKTAEVQRAEPAAPAESVPASKPEVTEERTVEAAIPAPASFDKSPTVTVSDKPILEQNQSTRLLLVGACFLLVLSAATIGFLVFRLRKTSQSSLISQSMSASRENTRSKS